MYIKTGVSALYYRCINQYVFLFWTLQGKLVYANYGRDEDFDELKKRDVNCTGKIVIMRYGKVGRSTKVSLKGRGQDGRNIKTA